MKMLQDEKRDLQKKEIHRLMRVFKELSVNKKKLSERLIEEAAFLRLILLEARTEMELNGITEEYQNGANQHGIKKSASFEVYDKSVDKYMRIYKQLADMLPEESRSTLPAAGEAMMGFVVNKP